MSIHGLLLCLVFLDHLVEEISKRVVSNEEWFFLGREGLISTLQISKPKSTVDLDMNTDGFVSRRNRQMTSPEPEMKGI
jgi:hypothetical protein